MGKPAPLAPPVSWLRPQPEHEPPFPVFQRHTYRDVEFYTREREPVPIHNIPYESRWMGALLFSRLVAAIVGICAMGWSVGKVILLALT